MPARINFAQFVEAERNDGTIYIDMPEGEPIGIPPSILWPPIATTRIRQQDETGAMRAILGDDQYDRFVDAGGTWLMFNRMYEQAKGTDVGEAPASPTE